MLDFGSIGIVEGNIPPSSEKIKHSKNTNNYLKTNFLL